MSHQNYEVECAGGLVSSGECPPPFSRQPHVHDSAVIVPHGARRTFAHRCQVPAQTRPRIMFERVQEGRSGAILAKAAKRNQAEGPRPAAEPLQT